MFHWYFINN